MPEFEIAFECLGWWVWTAAVPVLILLVRTLSFRKRSLLEWLGTTAFALLTAGSIAIGLSCPVLKSELPQLDIVALLDISDSMDDGVAHALITKAQALAPRQGTLSFLPFSGSAAPFVFPSIDPNGFSSLKRSLQKLDVGHTNIELAIHAGLRSVRSGSSGGAPHALLLLSDGHENEGSAVSALKIHQAAMGSTMPIFPLVPDSREAQVRQLAIAHLHAPLVAPARSSVEIRTTIRNVTPQPERGKLEIKHHERVIYSEIVTIPPHSEALFTAESDPSQEGIREIQARFIPDNKSYPPSSGIRYLSGEKRERVLLLNGETSDGALLRDVLQSQEYQTESIVLRDGEARQLQPASYSTIIINNASVPQLPSGFARELRSFIEQGGGVIFIGGNRAFGLGGYIGTAYEDLIPLRMLPPQAEQKRLNIAVELVIDKSRSMNEDMRLEFAKEAAREVVRNLKDEDYIGVIGFDTNPFEVVKLGQVGLIRNQALERIGRLFPNESTRLFPAMEEARRRLEGVPAGRKHMIIITDGALKDPGPWYLESIKQMRLLGISVSTVMIGGESDFGFLRSLAQAGGGAYYEATDVRALPRIFLQDVMVRSGERTMKENRDFPVRPGPDEGVSSRVRSFPPLLGFVENRAREGANLELIVLNEEASPPLLASWTIGKGKVIAFTSDANGRWSRLWSGWGRFSEFWSDLVDAARDPRAQQGGNIKFDLRPYVERDTLVIDVAVFSDVASEVLDGDLLLPDGTQRRVRFLREARGRYVAKVPGIGAGKYELQIAPEKDKIFTPVAFALSGDLFGERKGESPNGELLSRLASESGGKINPGRDDLDNLSTARKERSDISGWFYSLGALFFCLMVLWREILSKRVYGRGRAGRPGV